MTNSKYTSERIEKILDSLRSNGCILTACQAAEVSEGAFYKWIKQYPEFAKKVEEAKQEWRRSQPESLKAAAKKALADYIFNGQTIVWKKTGTRTKEVTDASGNLIRTETETFDEEHQEKRPCPQWAIERILGKEYNLLDAMQMLMQEGVVTPEQAQIVEQGVAAIEERLRSHQKQAEVAELN